MINYNSLDNTILKMFLNEIEKGDINQIKKFIINYNINIKTLIVLILNFVHIKE